MKFPKSGGIRTETRIEQPHMPVTKIGCLHGLGEHLLNRGTNPSPSLESTNQLGRDLVAGEMEKRRERGQVGGGQRAEPKGTTIREAQRQFSNGGRQRWGNRR